MSGAPQRRFSPTVQLRKPRRAISVEWLTAAALKAGDRRSRVSPWAARSALTWSSRAAWSWVAGAVVPRGSADPADGVTSTTRNAARPASVRLAAISSRSAGTRADLTGRTEDLRRGQFLERGGRALAAVVQPIQEQHLDRARDGDRCERPENPGQLGADEDRDEHGQRGELHRTPVDDGLQEVILDLLVDHE